MTSADKARSEWVSWWCDRLGYEACPECALNPAECACWMCDKHDVVTAADECADCREEVQAATDPCIRLAVEQERTRILKLHCGEHPVFTEMAVSR